MGRPFLLRLRGDMKSREKTRESTHESRGVLSKGVVERGVGGKEELKTFAVGIAVAAADRGGTNARGRVWKRKKKIVGFAPTSMLIERVERGVVIETQGNG